MSKRPTFYNLWKRGASSAMLAQLAELLLQEIPNKMVRTSLRWSIERCETHLYPAWSESLFDLLGLEGFRAYRQVLALFSKNDDLVIAGVDKSKAAWESYCKAEVLNGMQNRKMRNESQFWAHLGLDDSESVDIALDLIAEILGPCPTLADLRCRFGPGANVSCRQKTSARQKLSAPMGVSAEGLKALPELASLYPEFLTEHFNEGVFIVESAEVQEVSKNALTFRTIELQPLINTFVQLGIGSHMKKRLRLYGINLFSQDINQNRAKRASLTGRDATLDAEGASDSIAVRTVQFYLQRAPGWFELLSTWRCGSTQRGNLRFNSEKFSAMGNGFTFELESLLFWAIAEGSRRAHKVRGTVTIYGDDLICPVECVEHVVRLYGKSGFRINAAKSYACGRFRESCGGDYVLGDDVRPFYFKSRITNARLVGFANFLLKKNRFLKTWKFVCDSVADDVLKGPFGMGDGHLWDPDFVPATYGRERGLGCWIFDTMIQTPKRDCDGLGSLPKDYLLPAYTAYIGEDSSEFELNAWSVMEGESISFNGREHDPYVLRGGDRCRKVSTVTLKLPDWNPAIF